MWLVWGGGVLHAQREEKTAPVRICRHARKHASTHARTHARTHTQRVRARVCVRVMHAYLAGGRVDDERCGGDLTGRPSCSSAS